MSAASTDGGDRPFRILGLQQVAVGGASLDELRHFWCDMLGIAQTGTYTSEQENVTEAILEVGTDSGTVEIDLMQPLDPEARPRVDNPPLNHIGLWVDDLRSAVDWLTQHGVRFTPGGIRPGAAGHDICFIHPKGNESSPLGGNGVLIELVQAPPSIIQEQSFRSNDPELLKD